MKRELIVLLEFVIGLIMLVVGLFLFSHNATLTSTLISEGIKLGSVRINPLFFALPLAVGIVLYIVWPKAVFSKVISIIGVVVIVAGIVFTTTLTIPRKSLFQWLFDLVLIIGGAFLMCWSMFSENRGQ